MSTIEKMLYINKSISRTLLTGKNSRLAKTALIEYYKSNISKLDLISWDAIESHNWQGACKRKQEKMTYDSKRKKYIKILLTHIVSLEKHAYAPELSKVHFSNGSTFKDVKVNYKKSIGEYLDTVKSEDLFKLVQISHCK